MLKNGIIGQNKQMPNFHLDALREKSELSLYSFA